MAGSRSPEYCHGYDFGEDEGQPYMVLPLLSGGDVESLVEQSPDRRLAWIRPSELPKRFRAASSSPTPRDHPPGSEAGNVWLSADGTAKIGDFGLAVAVDLSVLPSQESLSDSGLYVTGTGDGGAITQRPISIRWHHALRDAGGPTPFVGENAIAVVASTSIRRRSRPRGTGPTCRWRLRC